MTMRWLYLLQHISVITERRIKTRKERIWYPGAIYHIMQRGIRRQEIYTTEGDYQYCLALLKKELKRYHCTLHAYCLMTNHYHLLLETSDKEVWNLTI